MVAFQSLYTVSYSNFVATMAVSLAVYEIFSVKEWRDLENLVRVCSGSLKMAPFDGSYTTFYWSAIVNVAVSCTDFWVIWRWILRDLEILVIGHSRSFKLLPFESFGAVCYSSSVVTMARSCIISEKQRDVGWKLWFFHTPCIRRPL